MGAFLSLLFGSTPPQAEPPSSAKATVITASAVSENKNVPLRHRPTTLSSAFENELQTNVI